MVLFVTLNIFLQVCFRPLLAVHNMEAALQGASSRTSQLLRRNCVHVLLLATHRVSLRPGRHVVCCHHHVRLFRLRQMRHRRPEEMTTTRPSLEPDY